MAFFFFLNLCHAETIFFLRKLVSLYSYLSCLSCLSCLFCLFCLFWFLVYSSFFLLFISFAFSSFFLFTLMIAFSSVYFLTLFIFFILFFSPFLLNKTITFTQLKFAYLLMLDFWINISLAIYSLVINFYS